MRTSVGCPDLPERGDRAPSSRWPFLSSATVLGHLWLPWQDPRGWDIQTGRWARKSGSSPLRQVYSGKKRPYLCGETMSPRREPCGWREWATQAGQSWSAGGGQGRWNVEVGHGAGGGSWGAVLSKPQTPKKFSTICQVTPLPRNCSGSPAAPHAPPGGREAGLGPRPPEASWIHGASRDQKLGFPQTLCGRVAGLRGR